MTEKTKQELIQKELLNMVTPDEDRLKMGDKVFISLEEVKKIIERLNEKFRKDNLPQRLGGDEFNDLWEKELKQKLGIK